LFLKPFLYFQDHKNKNWTLLYRIVRRNLDQLNRRGINPCGKVRGSPCSSRVSDYATVHMCVVCTTKPTRMWENYYRKWIKIINGEKYFSNKIKENGFFFTHLSFMKHSILEPKFSWQKNSLTLSCLVMVKNQDKTCFIRKYILAFLWMPNYILKTSLKFGLNFRKSKSIKFA